MPPETMSLMSEHLEDLRRSGLSDNAIAELQIEAIGPGDIKIPGVASAYRLPYFNLDGSTNCFERWRLFPPVKTEDGTRKYHQEFGTDPHLYCPPFLKWASVASRANCPVACAEGEKKAAKACQEGLITFGVGGVWSWRAKLDTGERLVLPTLDLFVWSGRSVEVVPDSDAWRPEKALDILSGFYALGQELIQRGASVRFVVLPERDGVKVGLDDWLVKVGAEWQHLWPKLERISLDDPSLKKVAAWWQRWRAKEAERDAAREPEQPAIQRIGSLLQFDWPRHGIRIMLDRLKESRERATAELTASVNGVALLTNASLNLKAPRTRNEFAKALAAKHPAAPWPSIIETICQRAVEIVREGDPVQHIAPGVEVEPLSFQLNPLVYAGRSTIVFSDGDNLKSYTGLFGGLCVDTGAKLAGLHGVRGRVLYLDYEAEHGDHVRRANCLRTAHPELAQADIFYWRCAVPLPDLAPQLHRFVAQHALKLLIVDSLALACGGDPQAPDTAIRFFQALRHLRCATLTIAHVPKNAEQPNIFGSVFFRNLARSCWELKKLHEPGTHEVRLGLFDTKHNLDGGHKPLGFRVTFAPDSTAFTSLDVAEEPGFAGGLPVIERVQKALAQVGQATAEELSGLTGISLGVMRNALSRENGRAVEPCEKKGKAFVWKLTENT